MSNNDLRVEIWITIAQYKLIHEIMTYMDIERKQLLQNLVQNKKREKFPSKIVKYPYSVLLFLTIQIV